MTDKTAIKKLLEELMDYSEYHRKRLGQKTRELIEQEGLPFGEAQLKAWNKYIKHETQGEAYQRWVEWRMKRGAKKYGDNGRG